MTDLALLIAPSTNRVYGGQAPRLALAELRLVEGRLHGSLGALSTRVVGGVEYLWVDGAGGLDGHDAFILSNLSSTFAMFEVAEDGRFGPIAMTPLAFYDSDLVTIQRYTGKTNEQFTHLLVNVALAASSAAAERSANGQPVRLLDPLAGRGTTLNRGLMYGFDVAGVEIDGRDWETYRAFLTTYLRDHRRRFTGEDATIRKGDLAGTKRFTMRIADGQRVDVVRGDTTQTDRHFPARSFDLLVADLPYGVQHGSSTNRTWARSPEDLVAAAIDGWSQVLRSGAGVALSWNTRTCPREVLEGRLSRAGLAVVDSSELDHRVDRSVLRGVVVATK